jgi:hypothetical protein
MANKVIRILFFVFCTAFLFYLVLPNFDFPKPPPDSLQSQEPGDTETPLRRAYFTNYTRAEVLSWYKDEFQNPSSMGIKLPTYLLNYPPEEAQSIIRDQTRSTFLQEVVHPFRESIYVNGFEPTNAKDAIFIGGKTWRQKIIIRFVPSSIWIRIGVYIVTITLISILYNTWRKAFVNKKYGKTFKSD